MFEPDQSKIVETTSCESCGYLVLITHPEKDHTIHCPRCSTLLYKAYDHAVRNCFICSLTGLILFIPGITYPIIKIYMANFYNSSSILANINALYTEGLVFVSMLVTLTVIILPIIYLSVMSYTSFSILIRKKLPFSRIALITLSYLDNWYMIDVFFFGVLVSLVKLIGMFDLQLEYGFYLIITISLLTTITEYYFNKRLFWKSWSLSE